MATFPSISPTYTGFSKSTEPAVRTVRFADGFEQRIFFGLPSNQIMKRYNLNFELSETEADVVDAFLTSRARGVALNDVLTIDYTSGSATDGSFAVASITSDNVFTVTAASSATNSGNVSITLSGAKQFVCEGWKKDIPYNNRARISATFRQVFEP